MADQEKYKILILCTGNTCRSPIAVVVLERLLKENRLDNVVVQSAGFISLGGVPASRTAVEVCRENGLDLSAHLSRNLTESLIRDADLIIVMEEAQKALLDRYSAAAQKEIRLLSEFSPDKSVGPDIHDPYGGNELLYERAFKDIRFCLEGLIPHLKDQLQVS